MREKEECKMTSMLPALQMGRCSSGILGKRMQKEEKTWNKLEQRRDEKVALDSVESGVPLGI